MKATKKIKFAIMAVDSVVFTTKRNRLHVLIVPVKSPTFVGSWAFPGGLVNPNERLYDASKRFLTNIPKKILDNSYTEQLYTFDDPKRDPSGRVISVAYMVLNSTENAGLLKNKAFSEARWVETNKLPNLAYDHNLILSTALERLRNKLEYTNIIFALMPREFTLSDLQKTYENILGRKLDKRNFRKKLYSLSLVKTTGKLKKGEAHRPAHLYRFKERKYQVMELI